VKVGRSGQSKEFGEFLLKVVPGLSLNGSKHLLQPLGFHSTFIINSGRQEDSSLNTALCSGLNDLDLKRM